MDVPDAFIHAYNEGERVIMKVRGHLAKMLVTMAPEVYKHYVVYENGHMVLYLEVVKALYGMLQSALLFYKKLRKDLEEYDFKVNPYDPCIANKMINGKQFTVAWHVDDLKISHENSKEIDKFIDWACDKYEDENGKLKYHVARSTSIWVCC